MPGPNPSAAGLLLASLALTACAPDGLLTPDEARPTTIVFASGAPAPLASLGDTAVLQPTVLDQHGRRLAGVRLRWSVREAGVVRADGDGIYTAVSDGRATIVAEVELGETGVRPGGYWAARLADSVVVEVRQRAGRLTLAPVDTAFGSLGGARQLRVQVTDARGNALLAAPPALVWRSVDSRVVSVDSAGMVRSTGEGAADITVESMELRASATFTVRPRLPHTSCMVFARRRQTRQSCVTLDFVVREREAGR